MKFSVHAHGRPYRIIKALRHQGVDDRIIKILPMESQFLLQENSDKLLQEDGGRIIIWK